MFVSKRSFLVHSKPAFIPQLILNNYRNQLHFHNSSYLRSKYDPQNILEEDFDPLPKSSAYKRPDETITVRSVISGMPKRLDPKYRVGYSPLYIGPDSKYIAASKRFSITFSILGIYLSWLIDSSLYFSKDISVISSLIAILPLPILNYYFSSYVTRVFRVYDKSKGPVQKFEDLVNDEKLVLEKINWSGKKTFNNLVHLENLKILNARSGWVSWEYTDPESNIKQYYYVADDIGGIKMDRIWGIIENNSNIDNGRFMDNSIILNQKDNNSRDNGN
ncbi:uncharacterized protein ASCRUDRAFT_74078 [Ascoidea rubescens DSM 1968]|uniref:Uncharacterized protein n=1 Tax=Ascoidea rubescens DSM 1968 TaxID=1344418 RepID=A0A1D2VSA1_9ASCO|nr:hypothetical protein ASCRUDRAFT_74078 [Ascoidea rubescens DSM 1968]ODV64458.1 hypothetical protein ASCRUDRAFT_74078 [Ascoidea rubescens DSM 1968]